MVDGVGGVFQRRDRGGGEEGGGVLSDKMRLVNESDRAT